MDQGRRFELPPGLSPQEERAVIAALERYFAEEPPPNPWAMAGRYEATGMGMLQSRRIAPGAWQRAGRGKFAREGTPRCTAAATPRSAVPGG
jgi:hypothetical protein